MIIVAAKPSMEYAKLCMDMRSGNARYSANPGDIAVQSNLICVPMLAIVKARPADQNGGSVRDGAGVIDWSRAAADGSHVRALRGGPRPGPAPGARPRPGTNTPR